MSAASNCRLIDRWRIVEADLWDREHLDLGRPCEASSSIHTSNRFRLAPCLARCPDHRRADVRGCRVSYQDHLEAGNILPVVGSDLRGS
jgi:hypothetical protein